jgi:hypothetical protein
MVIGDGMQVGLRRVGDGSTSYSIVELSLAVKRYGCRPWKF